MTLERVVIVHNRYREPGGEDVVYEQEAALLRANGHEVRILGLDSALLPPGVLGNVRTFAKAVWSKSSYVRVRQLLHDFKADVLHVHNFQPLLSPSTHHAGWAEDVAVVQTLHNYRLVCPAGTLRRAGADCELCVGHSTWRAVAYGCYRDSRAASAGVVAMLQTHRAIGTWRRVDAYIAISEFLLRVMVKGGLPADRMYLKPNFVPDDAPRRSGPGLYALFIGRLTAEKGVRTLIEAWSPSPDGRVPTLPLYVVGSGPEDEVMRRNASRAGANVTFFGEMSRQSAREMISQARLLVCPSEWQEPQGLVAVEALAAGVPVVASRVGGLAELVTDGETGALVPPADARVLAIAVARISNDLEANVRSGHRARAVFEARYTPAANYAVLRDIYASARARR